MYKALYCMDIGLRRSQQDCIYVDGDIYMENHFCGEKYINKDTALFAVCDGMGGLYEGEKASYFVGVNLKELDIPFSKKGIEKALYEIQKRFINRGFYNTGTTIAGVYLKGNKSIIFNAGDSRVYKITKDGIIYLSHDHSYVQRLVDSGEITQEQAFYHPAKNILEFGIGDVFQPDWKSGIRPYIVEDVLQKGEYYFLCTDGVNGVLKDEEIFYLLWPNPFENIERFLKELENRKSDNYSFIIVSTV